MDEIEVYQGKQTSASKALILSTGLRMTRVKMGHKCQAAAGVWGGKVTPLQQGFHQRGAVAVSPR